jgi:hypothetical protein
MMTNRQYQFPSQAPKADTDEEQPVARSTEPAVRPSLVEDPSLATSLEELDLGLAARPADAYLAPPPLMAQLAVPRSYGGWWQGPGASEAPEPGGSISEASLTEFDKGLPHEALVPDWLVKAPPLMTRLVLPRAQRTAPQVLVDAATGAAAEHAISPVTLTVALVLMTFMGAAAAALVLHEQLAAIIVQMQTYLR